MLTGCHTICESFELSGWKRPALLSSNRTKRDASLYIRLRRPRRRTTISKKIFITSGGIKPGVPRYRYYSEIELLQQPNGKRYIPKFLRCTHMKKEQNKGRMTSSEVLMVPSADGELDSRRRRQFGRRSFLKGLGMAGATLLPASALLATKVRANPGDASGSLTRGDAAILRFLAAAEIIESDLWEQYWELGGNQEADFASTNPATGVAPTPTGGNTPYTNGLLILDGDMPQYIQDNTDDEFSHANFLIAYLVSKGASVSELLQLTGTEFRTLPGSQADGSAKKGRLTNLTQLTVDTSYWGRYRTDNKNPDLDPAFKFDQAVP